MSRGMQWEIDAQGEKTRVAIVGAVDEDADFGALTRNLNGTGSKLVFDLERLTRINSCGVREWVNFIRGLKSTIELEKCSPPFVAQMNMITNFVGGAKVRSIVAQFVCQNCGHEQSVVFDVASKMVPDLSTRKCEKCGQTTLEFDDVPESYFAFLES
jgi:hypothetical protein